MAENLASSTWDEAKSHPFLIGGAVLALVLVIWYMQSSSSSAPATGSSNDAATEAAAAIQAAQTAANANNAQAQLAAGVTNNQTAAQQTVALAGITASENTALAQISASSTIAQAQASAAIGTAYYGSAAEIANANSSAAIAASQSQATEQESNNAVLLGEFNALAGNLNTFANTSVSQANTQILGVNGALPYLSQDAANAAIARVQGASVVTTAGASSAASSSSGYNAQGSTTISSPDASTQLFEALLGIGGASQPQTNSTSSFGNNGWSNAESLSGSNISTSFSGSANPNLTANNNAFLSGLQAVIGKFGVGIQAPQSQLPSNILSLAQINSAAVNSTFNKS